MNSARTHRPILFLDIDGVLLRRRPDAVRLHDAYAVAPHALEFLSWAVEHFTCRWLSARTRTGNPDGARRAFRMATGSLGVEWDVLDRIGAVCWSATKAEALEAVEDLFIIDDCPDEHVLAVLHACGRKDRLLRVSVDEDPYVLLQVISELKKRIGAR